MPQNMTKKQRMEHYRQSVEKDVVFRDNVTGHIFTRGPLLGKGGFGFVYQTTMPGYSRRMVLKAIPTARITKPSQRQRIQTEVSLHQRLKHENVAKLYHSFEEEHVICMIIERCERSLLDLLQYNNRKVGIEDASIFLGFFNCYHAYFYYLSSVFPVKNAFPHRHSPNDPSPQLPPRQQNNSPRHQTRQRSPQTRPLRQTHRLRPSQRI